MVEMRGVGLLSREYEGMIMINGSLGGGERGWVVCETIDLKEMFLIARS